MFFFFFLKDQEKYQLFSVEKSALFGPMKDLRLANWS